MNAVHRVETTGRKPKDRPAVLVVDGHDRRSLAAVRSLGCRAPKIQVVVASRRRISGSRFSRFASDFVRIHSDLDSEEFIDEVLRIIRAKGVGFVLPTDDAHAEVFSRHLTTFESETVVLVPDASSFLLARNKNRTYHLCRALGIPHPRLYSIEEARTDIVVFPVVVKPAVGNGGFGFRVLQSRTELDRFLKEQDDFEKWVIQEWVPSGGRMFQMDGLIDREGRLVGVTTKQSLRKFPLESGPSTFLRTVEREDIIEYGTQLMTAMGWVGPFEIDFLEDPDSKVPKLLEVNPRMSANIALSCFAGVDMPWLTYTVALAPEGAEGLEFRSEPDCYAQWLFPGDLLNFLVSPDRFRQEFGYFLARKPKKLCHMVFSWADPLPFFANALALFLSALSPKKLRWFIWR